jgi:hypothetical protein
MPQMPSKDDIMHQSEEATKDHGSDNAPVASALPDNLAADAIELSANELSAIELSAVELSADEGGAAPISSDHNMPQEFTFFQKKKHSGKVGLAPSVAYASTAQVTAFAARLDSAVAVNAKTQRHIAELMTLMSDVARTMTADVTKPARQKLRRSKWLFYGCLVGFGVGWFLLFPSGHNLVSQLMAFLTR